MFLFVLRGKNKQHSTLLLCIKVDEVFTSLESLSDVCILKVWFGLYSPREGLKFKTITSRQISHVSPPCVLTCCPLSHQQIGMDRLYGPAWFPTLQGTHRHYSALREFTAQGGYNVNPGMILMNVKNLRQEFWRNVVSEGMLERNLTQTQAREALTSAHIPRPWGIQGPCKRSVVEAPGHLLHLQPLLWLVPALFLVTLGAGWLFLEGLGSPTGRPWLVRISVMGASDATAPVTSTWSASVCREPQSDFLKKIHFSSKFWLCFCFFFIFKCSFAHTLFFPLTRRKEHMGGVESPSRKPSGVMS